MALFNTRFLQKTIGENPPPLPPEHRAVLEAWSHDITSHRIKEISEDQIEADFNKNIMMTVLGYSGRGADDTWNNQPKVQCGSGRVDLALGEFDKSGTQNVAVPFELKGAKTKDLDAIMSGRNISPVQQAWQYAVANEGTQWVMVCNMTELRLYAYGRGAGEYESWQLKNLTDPYEYAKFIRILSADNLLGGASKILLNKSRDADKDISEELYSDYKALRLSLIGEIRRNHPHINGRDSISYAQTILDRILFIAFAEDTGLLPEETLKKAYEFKNDYGDPVPVWQRFRALFAHIDKGYAPMNIPRYNGGLFQYDEAIEKLNLGDRVMEGFKDLGEYDFASDVRVTVLGRIFEQSITDIEELQQMGEGEFEAEAKKTTSVKGRRKREGVIYTPDYIAEFIVEQTIGKRLAELFSMSVAKYAKKGGVEDYKNIDWKGGKNPKEIEAWRDYRAQISKLKIVDPACGSGVFLVTAFDFLRAEYNRVNNKIAELDPTKRLDMFDADREVLTKNLYGVDVNEESVEITKLSLWLKTAKRGKVLDSLDDNIKVGDSLIGTSNMAYHKHDFDWLMAFKDVSQGKFDIVLGNPPYVRQERFKDLKPALKKRFEVYHGVADLFVYFFERGLRLLKDGGRLGYICSSTFFKTSSGAPLRSYILENGLIETMVDFGDIQVFEGVTTYPAVMGVKKGKPAKGMNTLFWTIDDLPEDNFAASFDKNAQKFDQHDLSPAAWKFEDPALTKLRIKLTKDRQTLKQVYGSPLYGIKTGRNEAFVIDKKTRDQLVKQDARSMERLKPWLVGRDLKKWRAEPQDQFLIFFPKGWTQTKYGVLSELEAWQNLSRDFPALSEHLYPYAAVCRKRTDKGDYWWELRACDYYDKFEAPKIVYGHFQNKPLYSFDEKNYFTNNKCYIFPNTGWFELALLNSSSLWFVFSRITTMMRGGYYEATTQNVVQLPIPDATNEQKEAIAVLAQACQSAAEQRYKIQQSVRQRIPDLCPDGQAAKLSNKLKNWHGFVDFAAFRKEIKRLYKTDIPLHERSDWEDWLGVERAKITQLTGEIAAGEAKINALVYELFDLTPQEIKLIEANT
ncbi:MAG: BREX-1 system adenine-specific DNA-methyltransferase PglX [Robiginitomaculum sp.]|nr:BREX-1 system adenine-specific DNA-methyltransferase PglX [Robiginitomaculum sp.]